MDKYVTVRSTDSKDTFYPDNKPYQFHVNLNKPLHLHNQWLVAVTDITLSNWMVKDKSECRDIYICSSTRD